MDSKTRITKELKELEKLAEGAVSTWPPGLPIHSLAPLAEI